MSTPTPIQNGQMETDSPDKRGSIIKTPYIDSQAQWEQCNIDCWAYYRNHLLGFVYWNDKKWVMACANKCMSPYRQETLRQGSHPDMMY